MEGQGCPLFTELHPKHNSVWSVPGFTLPTLCIACVIERLEKKELSLHTRRVLSELRALLGAGEGKQSDILRVLKSDKRVLESLCGHLIGILTSRDVSNMELATEVLMTLINLTQDVSDLSLKLLHTTIHTVMNSQSLPCSLPHLAFLGKLLHSNHSLNNTVVKSYANFLEFILGGLTYPDNSVKSSVVYVLVQVCSKAQANSLPFLLVNNMCRSISTNLATAKSKELTINLLGLVRHLLKSVVYTRCLLQADKLDSEAKGSTFASAFKRVLLSRDEVLQLSAVQCIEEVLSHHKDYGKVLLAADIAEFLFEALSTKNELLLSSLFSCLNSLATVGEFYTKCHVLYGIEAVLNGLSTALRMRAQTAIQKGLTLLLNIFKKQPNDMCLFPTQSGLQKLLGIVQTALQQKIPELSSLVSSILTNLLRSHHFPSNLPMNTLFPSMASLVFQVEPLTVPSQVPGLANDQKKLLRDVLQMFSQAYKSMYESAVANDDSSSDNRLAVSDEDVLFLFSALDESLLPAVLLHMDFIDDPQFYISIFSMAKHHIALSNATAAYSFAEKLANGAFINLIFDVKVIFQTAEGNKALCTAGNELLVSICFQLAKRSYTSSSSVSFVADTLKTALPHINCNPEGCLQYLWQKSPNVLFQRTTGHMTSGSPPITLLQHATLVLLHCAYSHEDILVPPTDVLKSIHKYLSLNPSIHLLPPVVLRCLASLFAEAQALCGASSTHQKEWAEDATRLLVQGLGRVKGELSQLCVYGDQSFLLWAFGQSALHQTIAKAMLLEWLKLLGTDKRYNVSVLLNVLKKSIPATQSLLSMLTNDNSAVPLDAALNILEELISKRADSEIRKEIKNSLQEIVTQQRVDPIPTNSLVIILKLLSSALSSSDEVKCASSGTIKLTYKVTGIVSRTDITGSCGGHIAEYGMDIISVVLEKHKEDAQIITLLLSDFPFLQRVASFLSDITTPKGHTTLSASTLRLLANLIDTQHTLNAKAQKSVSINPVSILSALSSSLSQVQAAGLMLWKVILSRGGKTCFVELKNDSIKPHSQHCDVNLLKTVLFLALNCLVNDSSTVRETAAGCIVEIPHHLESFKDRCLASPSHWVNTLMDYFTETYHCSSLPLIYVPAVAELIPLTSSSSDGPHMKQISQLLYKTYRTVSDKTPASHIHSAAFKTGFDKIQELDKDVLTTDQWSTVQTIYNDKI